MIADFHSFIDVAENGGHLIVIGMVVTDDGKFRRNEDTILTPATMTHTDRTSLFFQSGMIGQVTLGPFRWKNIGRIRMCFLLRFNQLHLFVVSASYEFSAFGLKNRKNRLKCFNHIFLKRKIYHKYAGISVSKIIIALTISHKVRTHFGRFIIIQTENYFRLDGPVDLEMHKAHTMSLAGR